MQLVKGFFFFARQIWQLLGVSSPVPTSSVFVAQPPTGGPPFKVTLAQILAQASGGSTDLATTLINGNTTGGTDIVVTGSTAIQNVPADGNGIPIRSDTTGDNLAWVVVDGANALAFLRVNSASGNTYLNVTDGGVTVDATNPASKGITGAQDFSANITDLDYPQKIYVDQKGIINITREAFITLAGTYAAGALYRITDATPGVILLDPDANNGVSPDYTFRFTTNEATIDQGSYYLGTTGNPDDTFTPNAASFTPTLTPGGSGTISAEAVEAAVYSVNGNLVTETLILSFHYLASDGDNGKIEYTTKFTLGTTQISSWSLVNLMLPIAATVGVVFNVGVPTLQISAVGGSLDDDFRIAIQTTYTLT